MTANTDAAPSEAFEDWASEEGINNFHFHHCWDAWQAALASVDIPAGDPIYQTGWPSPDDVWGDVPKEAYDTYSELGYTKRRIVYAAPPAAHLTTNAPESNDRQIGLTDSGIDEAVRAVERKIGIYWYVPDDSETFAQRPINTDEQRRFIRALLKEIKWSA